MDGEPDVLELALVGPLGGEGVGALLALLQPLDRLAVAGSVGELLPAGLDALGLGAGVESGDRPLELAAFDERLPGAEIGAVDGSCGRGALVATRGGETCLGLGEGGVTGPAKSELAGVGLLGGGLSLFAKPSDSLELESKAKHGATPP
jgi:hypothetical protein